MIDSKSTKDGTNFRALEMHEEFAPERLIEIVLRTRGNFVWIMNLARWRWLRVRGPRDADRKPYWMIDDTTAYGRLVGHRIVIVERDCFEVGLF